MRIIMFCINPLFPSQTMGGATKHLKNVAVHLGKLGHEVTILCARRPDSQENFRWHEQVEVKPILRFHQPFPQPYAAPGHHLAAIIQDLGDHLRSADRFYMHDGEMLFPYVYRDVPTVVSLRDVVYPETLQGGFLFQRDQLIMISHYARDHYLQTAGRFFPGWAERVHVIHNGIDWNQFKPTAPEHILDIVPVDPAETIILHPHRPESTKGLFQTIQVVDQLVNRYGLKVKTLVPRWLDTGLSAELAAFYEEIRREIAGRGLADHFLFHDWIPQRLMPEYYSLGAVTLSLGSFVETFGNSVYESLGCGTPVVVTRISTHRELLSDALVDKVDFGDIDSAAEIAAEIIQSGARTRPETLAVLHERYSIEKQLSAYAKVILEAEILPSLDYRPAPLDESTRWMLPCWCYLSPRGIYHDFRADYLQSDSLHTLLRDFPQGFRFADAQSQGIARDSVIDWLDEGYVVPASAR